MLDALSAEILKMRRHKATWFLVWGYPIAFTLILSVAIGVGMAKGSPDSQALSAWIKDTANIWSVPANSIGRYLISAFVVVVFAGEYGWNTWKLIVPHRSRTSLIAVKYGLVLVLFAAAFVLTALLSIFFAWADDVLTGDTIPAGITAGALWTVHSKAALAALAPMLVATGYASLAAILTRSTIAALVVTIVSITVEQLVFSQGPLLALKFPHVTPVLYHGLPGYHVANLSEWMREGVPLLANLAGEKVELPWATSLAASVAWIGGLIGLTFLSFHRQDLN